ncbi:MAG: hypothetical protein OES46_18660, partial [Gammaproteobacteria bacterium]|nr:hypothetical protein [Gammaproteobacteria bacterium]
VLVFQHRYNIRIHLNAGRGCVKTLFALTRSHIKGVWRWKWDDRPAQLPIPIKDVLLSRDATVLM